MTCHLMLACMTLLSTVSSVRMTDVDSSFELDGLSPGCTDKMRHIVRSISYTQLMGPVLQGTYRLQTLGGLLQQDLTLDGNLQTTERSVRWKFSRLKWDYKRTLEPVFTIRNIRSKQYLNMDEHGSITTTKKTRDALSAEWYVRVGSDGIQYVLQNAEYNVSLVWGEQLQGSSGPHALWTLVPYSRLSRKDRRSALWRQWHYAKDIPWVIDYASGKAMTKMTWGDACDECEPWYRNARESMVENMLLLENERNVVVENKVSGWCEARLEEMKAILHSPEILYSIEQMVEDSCETMIFEDLSIAFLGTVTSECFSDCIAALQTEARSMGSMDSQCEELRTGEMDQGALLSWLLTVYNTTEQCMELPWGSMLELGNWAIKQECWKWPPPDPLWERNDHWTNDLRAADNVGTCRIEFFEMETATSPEDIVQQGMCPEGSSCACPNLATSNEVSASKIREHAERTLSFIKPLKEDAERVWDKIRDAADVLREEFVIEYSGEVFFDLILHGEWAMPTWADLGHYIIDGMNWWTVGYEFASAKIEDVTDHVCSESVACWPQYPEKRDGKCRISASAESGGSPLWFMPMSGLKFELKKKLFGRRCNLVACTEDESIEQRVGFSEDRKVVYNCQPLSYANDMTSSQRTAYVQALSETGMGEEYSLPAM